MASSFLCSPASVEIRRLVLHRYPGGLKAAGSERVTVVYGCRGRAVKSPASCMPSWAISWARKLQVRRLGTVSVL